MKSAQECKRMEDIYKSWGIPEIVARNLVTLHSSANEAENVEAMQALELYCAQHSSESIINILVGNLTYDDDLAVFALGYIYDPKAVEPLIGALENGTPFIRYYAAIALGKIKDPRAVEPLINTLQKQEERKNDDAERSSWLQYLDLLQQRTMEEIAPDWSLRSACAIALGQLGGQQAVEALVNTLNDKKASVREAAERALEILGSQ